MKTDGEYARQRHSGTDRVRFGHPGHVRSRRSCCDDAEDVDRLDIGLAGASGGSILTLTAFGNVIIATTSNRQVVAYSDVGIRLWQFAVDDLAQTPPVRAGDQEAVLVDLAGVMRSFDLATGALLWRHDVGSDVNVAPAVGSGVVVIMDRGGTTTAFDVATGKRRWYVEMLGRGATVIGDTVVVLQDQAAHGLAIDNGLHRWVRPFLAP